MESGVEGVKLNLGSGKIDWDGWINVDLEKGDLRCDLRQLDLPNDHADMAIAVHVIEHFYAWEIPALLAEWKRVLKPGAKLVLELPCMDKVINYLHECVQQNIPISPSFSWFVFWGDPKHHDPLMVHKWGYTQQMIETELAAAGFVDIVFTEPRYHFPMRDMRVEAMKPCS
jgi:predicted SAM-dependent methyltransferase